MLDLKKNLLEGQTLTVELSMDFLFEKVVLSLDENLPNREAFANYMIANFKANNRLGDLFALTNHDYPATTRFEVGDIVVLKEGVDKSRMPYQYVGGEYHYATEAEVVHFDIVSKKLIVKCTLHHASKGELKFSGNVNPNDVELGDLLSVVAEEFH